jgi:hypothetical protein
VIFKILATALVSGAMLAAQSAAQTSATDPKPAGPTQSAGDQIPIKTIVNVEITDQISSKTNVIGDTFGLKLAAPLLIDGRTVLPAGLTGRGEVTHAAKSGGGGKAGELIVNARYLQCGDLRIPLGHFHYQIVGKNNIGGAYAASVVPFGQFLVSGHDAVIPPGTSGTAQVNADVVVPPDAVKQCTAAG